MLQKNNNAFTLIEIVVVLAIVGILAAVALPNLFSQIERNRAQEAVNTMTTIRSSIESCGVENSYDFSKCVNYSPLAGSAPNSINMSDPSNTGVDFLSNAVSNPGAKFNYTIPIHLDCNAQAALATCFSIQAARVSSTDTVIISRKKEGNFTCVGSGAYKKFC